MSSVTVRDLRNRSADVLGRVLDGERLIVTRDGEPVAALAPMGRRPLTVEQLIARRTHLPSVDGASLRADIDELMDSGL